MTATTKFDDLKFVRLTRPEQFSLIPQYLFKQVKDRDFSIDRIKEFGPVLLASSLTFLYILAEKEQLAEGYAPAKGVLWLTVNPFEEVFYVELLSVDKEYQGNKGDTLRGVVNFIQSIPEYKSLKPKIVMTTKHIKAFEKVGWKQSKKVRMIKEV